jgi:hypothetical protein
VGDVVLDDVQFAIVAGIQKLTQAAFIATQRLFAFKSKYDPAANAPDTHCLAETAYRIWSQGKHDVLRRTPIQDSR